MDKLVAKLPSGEYKSVSLHRDLLKEFNFVDMLVAAECHRLHLMARTLADVVDQVNAGVVILEIRGYFGIEVALGLKKVDQISTALFHQVGVNGALGKYR